MVTITISGTPGSGKSTVAQLVGKKLGLHYVYSGELFRKMAHDHHMSLEEFGKYCEMHRGIDEQLDAHQLELLQKGNVVLEGRIAGWIAHRNKIPAVKVLLHADIKTRSQRVVNREQGDVATRRQEIVERERSEMTRYKKYYNIDLMDTSIYDLVIDSSDKTPEAIVAVILEAIDQ